MDNTSSHRPYMYSRRVVERLFSRGPKLQEAALSGIEHEDADWPPLLSEGWSYSCILDRLRAVDIIVACSSLSATLI